MSQPEESIASSQPTTSDSESENTAQSLQSSSEGMLSIFDDCDVPLSERSSLSGYSEVSDVADFFIEQVPSTNLSMLIDPAEPFLHVYENATEQAPPDAGVAGWEDDEEPPDEELVQVSVCLSAHYFDP